MDYYAGIDVSLKESSVCVVDAKGKVVREVKVASEHEAVVRHFDELELPLCRIGLEAGPRSQLLGGKLVRTISIVPATMKIGMLNLASNMSRLVVLERSGLAAG